MHKGCNVRWSFAQIGLLIICAFHVVQAVIGFIMNPSFATGPSAPTVQLFGMDYNGWHAVAGLALFAPGLVFAMRKSWAVLYLLLAAIAGALPGIWAFFSHQVAVVFTFPNNVTDAVVHLVTAAVMVAVAAVQIRMDGDCETRSPISGRRVRSRRTEISTSWKRQGPALWTSGRVDVT